MLQRILVPLDGSELADRILPVVRGLASSGNSEVMLLHVLPAESSGMPELVKSGSQYLEKKWLALADSVQRVRFDLMSGDPAESILTFAATYQPTLIALATHGRTGISRLVHGSVTETVLRKAPYPVLAVSPFSLEGSTVPRSLKFETILVPLDGTEASRTVLPLVREIARLSDATVTLLHVVEPLAAVPADVALSLGGVGVIDPPIRLSDMQTFLDPAARELERSGIRVRTIARMGLPATEICEVAREVGADLVAMATHGRTGLARLFFGSCCEDVLHRAKCPILAVNTLAKAGEPEPAPAIAGA